MHHAYSVLALLYLVDKGLHPKRIYTSHLSHIISVLVIPNEFPTLLAKREIIANAFVFTHNVLGTILILEQYPMQRYKFYF